MEPATPITSCGPSRSRRLAALVRAAERLDQRTAPGARAWARVLDQHPATAVPGPRSVAARVREARAVAAEGSAPLRDVIGAWWVVVGAYEGVDEARRARARVALAGHLAAAGRTEAALEQVDLAIEVATGLDLAGARTEAYVVRATVTIRIGLDAALADLDRVAHLVAPSQDWWDNHLDRLLERSVLQPSRGTALAEGFALMAAARVAAVARHEPGDAIDHLRAAVAFLRASDDDRAEAALELAFELLADALDDLGRAAANRSAWLGTPA